MTRKAAGPLPQVPADAIRPTHFQGAKILKDERASNLPGRFFNYRRIDLATGERAFGCWDCPHVMSSSYNDIYEHRITDHPDDLKMPPIPRRAKRIAAERAKDDTPPESAATRKARADGRFVASLPPQARTWTLVDIIEMAEASARIGNKLEAAVAERTEILAELAQTRAELNDAQSQLAKVKKALSRLGLIKEAN
jgi:hypothetical protein